MSRSEWKDRRTVALYDRHDHHAKRTKTRSNRAAGHLDEVAKLESTIGKVGGKMNPGHERNAFKAYSEVKGHRGGANVTEGVKSKQIERRGKAGSFVGHRQVGGPTAPIASTKAADKATAEQPWRQPNNRVGELGDAEVRRGMPLAGRALAGAGGRGSAARLTLVRVRVRIRVSVRVRVRAS